MTEGKDLSVSALKVCPQGTQIFPKLRKCPILYKKNKDTGEKNITIDITQVSKETEETVFAQGICELTGTHNKELAEEIILAGALAISNDGDPFEKNNIIAQALWEQKPKDSHEARLGLQATALYSQGMRYLHLCQQENKIPQCEYYMKNALKLLRLHSETIESLNRYRRGGEQRVIVQHVQVNDGGKAVVGGVFEGGGSKEKSNEVGHGHSSDM